MSWSDIVVGQHWATDIFFSWAEEGGGGGGGCVCVCVCVYHLRILHMEVTGVWAACSRF